MNAWRLLCSDDPVHLESGVEQHYSTEAQWNMQYDTELLEGVRTNRLPPTLRLYCWKRPAMTVGRFQNIERTINTEFCQQNGIPIIRRITGGRGILHGTDLTVALAVPISHLLPQGYEAKGIAQVYAVISQVFSKAFAECGILTQQGREADNQNRAGNCFAVHSQADIVATDGTEKILGAALHRSGEYVLMQASVPRSGDEAILNQAFIGEPGCRALDSDFSLHDLEAAIIRNFAENFTISYLIS